LTRLLVAVSLVCATLLTVAGADARTDGGDVLWQDEFDAIEISASDGRVAAVGTVLNPDGGLRSLVRVYDADRGTLLWQDAVAAQSVVLAGNRAVVAGGGAVRGYDAKKGRLEWRDVAPFVVTQLYRDEDTTLATALTPDGTAIRVRVYDTKRGTVLVRDQILRDESFGPSVPAVSAFSGGRMFVASRTAVDDPTDDTGQLIFPCQVRAYSITTGARLWTTTQPVLVPNTRDCGPRAITADRKRVVLVGIGSFFNDFMAQGYDARTGAFLWQHLSLVGTGLIDAAVAVDVDGRLAFVGGWTRSTDPAAFSFDQDFVIHALNTSTGVLRWEARSRAPGCPQPGVGRCQAHMRLVVVDSRTVYGAGFLGETGISIPGTGFLQAYESQSGLLRWQDDDVDVQALAATKGSVVILTPGADSDEVMLRAYDGR